VNYIADFAAPVSNRLDKFNPEELHWRLAFCPLATQQSA
jgi:hypothetical protein